MLTKPINVKAFGPRDLKLLNCSEELKELHKLLERVLKKQRKDAFAVVVKLPYKGVAWQKKEPNIAWPDDSNLARFTANPSEKVVGLVTNNVMEIYVEVNNKATTRRKTTAVLSPGMFFGLFEAYADYSGDWTITSGIVSFLVCNVVGNQARWARAHGTLSKETAKHLQIDKESKLTHDNLLPNSACSAWSSESVWLKPGLIEDESLRLQVDNFLRGVTIRQLVSVGRQNPTWGRVGEGGT